MAVVNLALVLAVALTAIYWLPTISRFAEQAQPTSPEVDWSENRLAEQLREELTDTDCVAATDVIEATDSKSDLAEVVAEVGLDIYLARDALLEIDAPQLGFVATLTEQIELVSGRALSVVFEKQPEFEKRLGFDEMLDRATLELLSFCELAQPLGEAIATQRQADSALESLRELAAESAWYPRGFTRTSQNLAWGWTSESGGAPCQNCVYWKVTLVTRDGCLGGALVELRIFDGDAELVTSRETWPRLREEQSVTAEFPFQQLNPDLTAQVTAAECFTHEQP